MPPDGGTAAPPLGSPLPPLVAPGAAPPPAAAPRVAAIKPTFVSPTEGQALEAGQPFTWVAVPGASEYCLTVGTTRGGADLLNTGPLTPQQTSFAAPSLPPGQRLWARVYSSVEGRWSHAEITFEVVADEPQPEFLWPQDGQSGVGIDRPFSWTRVPWAINYWLTIGTTVGGSDLLNTGPLPASQTSYANLPQLPTGMTLYARLLTNDGSDWASFDVAFTAGAG